MPKLHILLPCVRGIVDREDNTLSIVSVMDSYNVRATPAAGVSDEEIVRGVNLPMRWTVVTLWQRLPGEEDAEFEMRITLETPAGRLGLDGILPFRLTHRWMRNNLTVEGLPADQSGDYLLRAYLRRPGEADWGSPRGEYPIQIGVEITAPDADILAEAATE